MCPTGKVTYHRKADAKRALRRLQTRGVALTTVYRCPDCGAFHHTSQTAAVRRAWRERLDSA